MFARAEDKKCSFVPERVKIRYPFYRCFFFFLLLCIVSCRETCTGTHWHTTATLQLCYRLKHCRDICYLSLKHVTVRSNWWARAWDTAAQADGTRSLSTTKNDVEQKAWANNMFAVIMRFTIRGICTTLCTTICRTNALCVCVCVACTGSRYWWQRHLLAAHTYTAMHLHIATLPKVDEPRAVGNHQRMALAATQNDVAPQRKRNETVVRW